MRLFGDLAFQEKIPTYVSPPLGVIEKSFDHLDQEYRTNLATMDKLEIAVANAPVRPEEEDLRDATLEQLRSGIGAVMEAGDVEFAHDRVAALTKQVGTDTGLAKAIELKKESDKYHALKAEMAAKGITPLEFNSPDNFRLQNEDGTLNDIPKFSIESQLDYGTKMGQIWQQVNPDTIPKGLDPVLDSITGEDLAILKSGSITGISPAKIKALTDYAFTQYKNTQEGQQHIRKMQGIDGFKDPKQIEAVLKDELVNVGLIRQFTDSKDNYMTNQLRLLQARAAEKNKEKADGVGNITTLAGSGVSYSTLTGVSDAATADQFLEEKETALEVTNEAIDSLYTKMSNTTDKNEKIQISRDIGRLTNQAEVQYAELERARDMNEQGYVRWLANPINSEGLAHPDVTPLSGMDKAAVEANNEWDIATLTSEELEEWDDWFTDWSGKNANIPSATWSMVGELLHRPYTEDELLNDPSLPVDGTTRIDPDFDKEDLIKMMYSSYTQEEGHKTLIGNDPEQAEYRYYKTKDNAGDYAGKYTRTTLASVPFATDEGKIYHMRGDLYDKLTQGGTRKLSQKGISDLIKVQNYMHGVWGLREKHRQHRDEYYNVKGQQEISPTVFDFGSDAEGKQSAASEAASRQVNDNKNAFTYIVDGKVINGNLQQHAPATRENVVTGMSWLGDKGWMYFGHADIMNDKGKPTGRSVEFYAVPNDTKLVGNNRLAALTNTLKTELDILDKGSSKYGSAKDFYDHLQNEDTERQLAAFLYNPPAEGEHMVEEFVVDSNKILEVHRTTNGGMTTYRIKERFGGATTREIDSFWDLASMLDEAKRGSDMRDIYGFDFENGDINLDSVELHDGEARLRGDMLMEFQSLERALPSYTITSTLRSKDNPDYSGGGHSRGVGIDIIGEGGDNSDLLNFFNAMNIDITNGQRHKIPGTKLSVLYHGDNDGFGSHFDIKLVE